MELLTVKIEKPEDVNVIIGQSHFIKTVEDAHEAMINAVPGIEFGLAFCEASGPALIRLSGTSAAMVEVAKANAQAISAGHVFLIFLANAYPLNVLNSLKAVPEICRIFCATANPLEVVLVETDQGRGVIGVIDGVKSKGVETEVDVVERVGLLRKFGYKLGG
jgi:adenosine/AMP kinase